MIFVSGIHLLRVPLNPIRQSTGHGSVRSSPCRVDAGCRSNRLRELVSEPRLAIPCGFRMSSARAFFSDPSWLVRRTSFLKVGFAAPDERGCIAWSESWTGRSLFFAPIGCQNQLTTASTAVLFAVACRSTIPLFRSPAQRRGRSPCSCR